LRCYNDLYKDKQRKDKTVDFINIVYEDTPAMVVPEARITCSCGFLEKADIQDAAKRAVSHSRGVHAGEKSVMLNARVPVDLLTGLPQF
jgi:hypothetical protein